MQKVRRWMDERATRELMLVEYEILLLERGYEKHVGLVEQQREDLKEAEIQYADHTSQLWNYYYNSDYELWKQTAPYYVQHNDESLESGMVGYEQAVNAIIASYPGPDTGNYQLSEAWSIYTSLKEVRTTGISSDSAVQRQRKP